MQQTPAERRAELNRNTISGFRKVFLGPGLFLTLLSVCVILWPFGLAPPLLTFAFWWWLLVAWPGLNLMFRPDQTRELLERIWIIGGHALAIVWDIVADWARELYARGISLLIRIRNKPRAAPERQRPQKPDKIGHGLANFGHRNRFWTGVSGFARVLRNLPWRLIAIVACLAAVAWIARPVWRFATCPFGICETKQELRAERDAARKELARTKDELAAARHAAEAAHERFLQDRANREREAEQRTTVRVRRAREARREIANAETFDAQYDAYLAVRRELRDQAAARHARAVAHYLSSLPAGA